MSSGIGDLGCCQTSQARYLSSHSIDSVDCEQKPWYRRLSQATCLLQHSVALASCLLESRTAHFAKSEKGRYRTGKWQSPQSSDLSFLLFFVPSYVSSRFSLFSRFRRFHKRLSSLLLGFPCRFPQCLFVVLAWFADFVELLRFSLRSPFRFLRGFFLLALFLGRSLLRLCWPFAIAVVFTAAAAAVVVIV